MVPQPHTRARLSDRQPARATRQSTADHPTPMPHLAWPASARPPDARKGTTRGAPPLPETTEPLPPVRHAGGCMQPVLIRGASTTSTGPRGNCCIATPPSMSPAASCRSPARPAAPRDARRALRPTAPTPTSSSAPGLPAASGSPPPSPPIRPRSSPSPPPPSARSTPAGNRNGRILRCRPRPQAGERRRNDLPAQGRPVRGSGIRSDHRRDRQARAPWSAGTGLGSRIPMR
jgi:hypothetical protein